jgi:ElaB/YqjD/DUF883 family membrane-anchored ribosome-binding protein
MPTPSQNAAANGASAVRQLSDNLLDGAEHALQSGRELASDTLDRANSKVRDFRASVEPVIDRFASRAQDYANRGLSVASDASVAAQRRLNHYADRTGRFVADEPVKAVLIAAAAGAVLAGLLIAARRNR